MKVEVYRNLHKNCWSVRDTKTGRVVDHVPYICVKDAKLVVRPAGRAKVLREQRKNVHAFIRGTAALSLELNGWGLQQISYNPYKNESFILTDTNIAINSAEAVFLDSNGNGWIDGKYN
jgi:hypothetical protein